MDMKCFFEPVRKIEMPEDMQRRIVLRCLSARPRKGIPVKKTLLITAALAAVLCITAFCAGRAGYFRDIRNLSGAVTGTEYLQASEEICMQASLTESGLCLRIAFVDPGKFPYREIEHIALGSFSITDDAGNVLLTGTSSDPFPVSEGQAEIMIALPETSGPCTLSVSSFIAGKKADQSLKINGEWVCPIP